MISGCDSQLVNVVLNCEEREKLKVICIWRTLRSNKMDRKPPVNNVQKSRKIEEIRRSPVTSQRSFVLDTGISRRSFLSPTAPAPVNRGRNLKTVSSPKATLPRSTSSLQSLLSPRASIHGRNLNTVSSPKASLPRSTSIGLLSPRPSTRGISSGPKISASVCSEKKFPNHSQNKHVKLPSTISVRKKIEQKENPNCFIIKKQNSVYGYTTLDDYRSTLFSSDALHQEAFVPVAHHKECHVTEWINWLEKLPAWMLETVTEQLQTHGKRKNTQRPQKKGIRLENNENNLNISNVKIKNEECEFDDKTEDSDDDNKMKLHQLKEWRDWSLRLTDCGQLFITGKSKENTIETSKDVLNCERIDANRLLLDGSLYLIVGMADHFTNIPSFVRNKFLCGFPGDWKAVIMMWKKYKENGAPSDFNWKSDQFLDATIDVNFTFQENENFLASTPVNNEATFVINPAKEVVQQSFISKVEGKETLLSIVGATEDNKDEKLSHPTNNQLEQSHNKPSHSELTKSHLKRPNLKINHGDVKRPREMKAHVKSQANGTNENNAGVNVPTSRTSRPTPSEQSSVINTKSNSANIDVVEVGDSKLVSEEITLIKWIPILVNGCDLKIEGSVKSIQAEVRRTTDMVEIRKTSHSFRSKDGKTYRLKGSCTDPKNSIPIEIQKKLKNGLPVHWKMMLRTWASLNGHKK